MSALGDLLAARTALSDDEVNHLQRLVGEWQLVSDLSFADLVLWVPSGPDGAEEGRSYPSRPCRRGPARMERPPERPSRPPRAVTAAPS